MHLLICPDSYKDALSAKEAAQAMAKGALRACPEVKITECPLADGGEGSLEAILAATGAERRYAWVKDALGRPCRAAWGWKSETRTAFIELAEASGLQALSLQERTALHSSTYGVGELIREALDAEAKHIVVLLGGSATNDGGAGMLTALGARLMNASHQPLLPGGAALGDLEYLDITELDSRLPGVNISAAVDVDNPLLGKRGATAVFGPQKGANDDDVIALDAALTRFADKTRQVLGMDYRDLPGVGAAGGIGFALKAFLNAKLMPGVELIIEYVGIEPHLVTADMVITGEGQLDGQSLSGKTPIGIARLAKRYNVPVIVLAGRLGPEWQSALKEGVSTAFALADGPMHLNEALARCAELLSDRTESVLRMRMAFDK
ncbi:glycerate kinase [Halomonas dongshanensis]|uniref:Glycerate kinase n=1 Tax=Halomonas dongshanensis TaxID=2890835 RepID=A0ABT2EDJ0_9GAMM|nr:glycerate kinase [Halomonas dongshanensis]MCS2608734.1 glycerate kinase [Halomonas dongshanensis]